MASCRPPTHLLASAFHDHSIRSRALPTAESSFKPVSVRMPIHHKVPFTNLRSFYHASTDRRPSGEPLNLNLPSNNPFRNGAPSPAIRSEPSTSPGNPFVKDRPVSRNPFFDSLPADDNRSSTQSQSYQHGPRSPPASATVMSTASEQKSLATSSTAELLVRIFVHLNCSHSMGDVCPCWFIYASQCSKSDWSFLRCMIMGY